MIAALRGEVIHIGLDHGVIDCAGVGYKFLATPKTLGTLRRGEQATVLTNLVVKEDSLTLYGFSADEDREMFHVLQSVSGLGPKLALAALSVMGGRGARCGNWCGRCKGAAVYSGRRQAYGPTLGAGAER